jgi:hypothetical protein
MRSDGDGERRDDGQGQRDSKSHPRALARRAVHLDDSADALDVGTDDVHSDPAARNRRHFPGGGKAGLEHQRQLLARGELGRLLLVHDSGRDGLFDQPAAVDSAAVILDVDEDLVS